MFSLLTAEALSYNTNTANNNNNNSNNNNTSNNTGNNPDISLKLALQDATLAQTIRNKPELQLYYKQVSSGEEDETVSSIYRGNSLVLDFSPSYQSDFPFLLYCFGPYTIYSDIHNLFPSYLKEIKQGELLGKGAIDVHKIYIDEEELLKDYQSRQVQLSIKMATARMDLLEQQQ